MSQYLVRADWPGYILGKHGLRYSKNTFTKLATTGGGPQYCLFGNRAVSTPQWLDEWVTEKLSSPRRSTSDVSPDAA